MDTFDLVQQREIKKMIVAYNRRQPENTKIDENIDQYNLDATKQDVKDWQGARLTALDYMLPDWTDLIRVYDDVMVDAFLTGIVETIKDIVKSKEFKIVNKAGDEQEDKKTLFEQKWFFRFLDYCVDSFFYPYSVVQLGDMIDDKFKDIKLIDREYFIPQKNFVKKNLFSFGSYKHKFDGWDITQPELVNYYIVIKANHKLGLLDKVAYHSLGKKHMLIYWWRYGEIFGLPIRIGKTDIRDNARRRNMETMVSNMGNSLWGVIDPEDEVNLVESKSSGNNNFFKDLMNHSNYEMSVALAGSETIFKEKSFVGSAEVGERIFELRQKSILRDVSFIINNELIPRMVIYGLPLKGLELKWVQEDNVSYDEKIRAVQTLGTLFSLDADEVGNKMGFKLIPKQMNQQNEVIEDIKNREKTSVMPEVKALYENIVAPIPTKRKDERKKDFLSRCMADPVMVSEYPDEKQRLAICSTKVK